MRCTLAHVRQQHRPHSARVCHVGQVKDLSGPKPGLRQPAKPLKMRDPLWAVSAYLTSKTPNVTSPSSRLFGLE
jgi:hypothetical protein